MHLPQHIFFTKQLFGYSTGFSLPKLTASSGDDYELLDDIYKILDTNYIEDVEKDALITEAAKGIVYGSGDTYGTYFTEDEFAQFTKEDNGEYVGIGVLINIGENNKITVAQVYSNSPAHDAGIMPGDIIVGVDGDNIIGIDYTIVVDRVRGEPGTEVTVTVNRNGEDYDYTMERAEIIADQATWKMLDNNIGYLQLHEFSGNASELFHKGLLDLAEQGMEGLVLDLRYNPGGSKDIAVEIGDTLFPKGEIITLIDSAGNEDTDYSDADFLDIPMVVLVNDGSASASELISGCVQDYGVGLLVGETTFGKGVAQSFHNVPAGGVVRVTSSYYETAGGRCPQDTGFEPDVYVEPSEELTNDFTLMELTRTTNYRLVSKY